MDTNTTIDYESATALTPGPEPDSIPNPQSEISNEHSEPRQSPVGGQPAFPRSPGESPRAYSAFITFFQLGHSRSLQAVSDKLDENISTIKKWSSKFSWSDRIQSFNAGVLQQHAEAEATAQRERAAEWSARMADLRQQEWTAGQKLLSVVQFYLESCGDEHLDKMNLSQVARALTISSDISRQAIGADPTEKAEPAMSPIQIQLTDALKRVLGNSGSPSPNPDSSCSFTPCAN